jgi:hydrogenase maturation protease
MSGSDRVWYVLLSRPPDSVMVAGRVVTRGSRVRLMPSGRSDAFDSILAGKLGRVEAIEQDQDGKLHLAVAIEDDPGRDLADGRHPAHRFFFLPSEIEPLDDMHEVPARRLLIAGIGNMFLGDDAFGVEVVRRLAERVLPPGVEVADFGIRGMDLVYALGNGWQGVILVDAMRRGEPPGTLVVLEPELPAPGVSVPDAHAMDPVAVLAAARSQGMMPKRVLVVGCEPALVPELQDGDDMVTDLSPEVEAAVEVAVERIVELAAAFARNGRFTGADLPAPAPAEVRS